jgi:hypothetical protein
MDGNGSRFPRCCLSSAMHRLEWRARRRAGNAKWKLNLRIAFTIPSARWAEGYRSHKQAQLSTTSIFKDIKK